MIVPPDVKAELAVSHKNATLRSLMLQREIVLVHQILTQANTPYVALKGAFLAYHAYPHPGLRPLRDVDVLVPKDRTLEAYQVLLDGGFARMRQFPGIPKAVMEVLHHLPPVRSASGRVHVELHSRLFDHKKNGLAQADPSETREFWGRCIQRPLANHAITFQSPTDLLLHLIEHAVYHHKFNNGPLLLSDLAFLVSTQTIDWKLFWEMAKKGQQTRGCLLALKLTQRYWGVDRIVWPPVVEPEPTLMDEPLDTAALLMLRDLSSSSDMNLDNEIGRAKGSIARIGVMLSKAFPPKAMISASYPVAQNSWRVYLWYPVKWHHLLTKRLFGFLKFRQQRHLRSEIKQIAALDQWLAG